MAKVTMPQLGESVAEGTIGRWLKKPGDRVEKYEPIVEVITDKVNAEVPSPFAGILTAILAEEGATVPNNAEIAEIETSEAETVPAPATAVPAAQASTPTPPRRRSAAPARPRLGPVRHRARRCIRRGRADVDAARRGAASTPRRPDRDRGGPVDPSRARRPRRAHDPGRPPAAPRARPVGRPGPRHRRGRPDHPRRRARGGRDHPDRRHRPAIVAPAGSAAAPAAAPATPPAPPGRLHRRPAPHPRRPAPSSSSRRAPTRSSCR